jgi:hypothetical protein
MNPQLIAVCQMFLIPLSVLFTALGTARTEGLKTGVSIIGLVISGAWFWRICVWHELSTSDLVTALLFAGIFLAASATSFVVHGMAWWAGE